MRLFFALLWLSISLTAAEPKHLFIHVVLAESFHEPVAGRLLVFVSPGTAAKALDSNPFKASSSYVFAKEVQDWQPGTTVDIDADETVYPAPLSGAKPGDYQIQALLDVDHHYVYAGRASENVASDIITLKDFDPAHGILNALTLVRKGNTQFVPATENYANVEPFSFVSTSLSAFWGYGVSLRGFVVLPPSYKDHPKERYPTVYWTHGFGGTYLTLRPYAEMFFKRMAEKKMPEMIWVVLDQSCPHGTHEFADSVNNGPWGHALTAELIPHLESKYRMDAKPSGRFLQGHSSGGWATLWLQTRYPKIFGGTWSTSPDPSDFHDFTGIDLYAPRANVYRKPDGSPYPLVRDKGQVLASFEQFARQEEVVGEYGGQMASFDWVFSPRGQDGKPEPMFNRATGNVNPTVVAYWRDHYDIANLVRTNWKTLAPDLTGKIHLFVGTADTFYLDGPAHKLQAVLDSLNARAHFTFIPDRTHMDLYNVGDDSEGLYDQIAKEMYAVARPKK